MLKNETISMKVEVDLLKKEITVFESGQAMKSNGVLVFYSTSDDHPGVFCYGDKTALARAIGGCYMIAVHEQNDHLKSAFRMLVEVMERISDHLKRWLTFEQAIEKWSKPPEEKMLN